MEVAVVNNMKYIKTYEQNNYYIDRHSIFKFIKKIIKKIGDDSFYPYLSNNNIKISLYKNITPDFTELISNINIYNLNNVLIFEVYNPKYFINEMLIEYFSMSMKLIYEKDYHFSFKFNRNSKLNINDFETLLKSKKYNI